MLSTHSLLPKLIADFPDITFSAGQRFSWSPDKKTVFYDEADSANIELLLHELSHGILGHHEYSKDIELLAMETAAWDTARELGKKYSVAISKESSEDNLDTYRDWLHARSSCPTCDAVGYQSTKDTYTCVACTGTWRVNEARLCALRRYSVNT